MQIKFLGRWSSNLVAGERHVSFVLDDTIAFDFGPHALESLLDRGLDPNKIRILLISHMHLDHYIGLAELLWYRSIYNAKEKLTVLGPVGIGTHTQLLMKLVETPQIWHDKQINPRTEFVEDSDFEFIRVFHADHSVPCNSYRVEYKKRTIFYSGDTAYSTNVVEGATNADYLFHEMTYTDKDRKLADFWRHSTYSDAMRVYNESGAKQLVPVHLTLATHTMLAKKVGVVRGLNYPANVMDI